MRKARLVEKSGCILVEKRPVGFQREEIIAAQDDRAKRLWRVTPGSRTAEPLSSNSTPTPR
jgi:hypothetical protein